VARTYLAFTGTHYCYAPATITLDGYAASLRAVGEMKTDEIAAPANETAILEIPEQPDRARSPVHYPKSRVNVMLEFKCFRNEVVAISGIELMHRIRKGRCDLTSVHLKGTNAPSI
jgi:hypothetical protein